MVILKSSDEVLLSLKLGKSGGLKKLYKLVYDMALRWTNRQFFIQIAEFTKCFSRSFLKSIVI